MKYLLRVVVFSLQLLNATVFAQTSPLVPAAEQVAGKSQAEWSRVWWQWAGSFDRAESPVSDKTGELCGLKQVGPVWFLAGTYGTGRTVRECAVPRDKYLFFPLVNSVVVRGIDSDAGCMGLMSKAARITEGATALVLEVDGAREPSDLVAHRLAPVGCFDLSALTDRPVNLPAAANGYYVMLRPLAPGRHTLNFGGALPGVLQAVTYTLQIE
jgi:hypothetical protein